MFHFPGFRKIYISIGLIILIILVGIAGYMSIEHWNFFDSFYMTIITISTVGFAEVHHLSDPGRLFTTFLIIGSFGTFANAVFTITRSFSDGAFLKYINDLRLFASIDKLENHVILCGYGRNGKEAAHVLKNHDQRFVVVEEKQQVVDAMSTRYKELILVGNATQDEVLLRAGVMKAKALITTLPLDADNLFIVLSARTLNPKLTIISRASDDNSDRKLKAAGADNVIMPDKIGGAHMASLVMKPDVMEFLDYITGQGGEHIKLEEITFDNLSANYKNKTIRDLEVRNKSGANIVGFKTAKGEYVINPSPDTQMIHDAKLFVLGTTDQINKLRELFS
ncbi:MAG TPA: potassium channel protein [Bacteroidia bacterium]|nr:potassium channel protein [Bacteroidia bacterium]